MDPNTRIKSIKFLILIFWIAAYGGFALGFLDFWNNFIPWKKLLFLLGWIVSIILGSLVAHRTLKNKGYINLLWVALPIPMMWGTDLFLCVPLFRLFFIIVVLMVGVSSLWFAFQDPRHGSKRYE